MSGTMPAADSLLPVPPPGRGVFCNRTLNLRAIRAVGFDMDYTLVHYRVDQWERRAYAYLQQKLHEIQWPVDDLEFPAGFAMRGLVIDTDLGNLVKADRFGYVKRATHGTRRLGFDEQRQAYARVQVDLAERRWVFLNTFFSLSEASMYAQLVEQLDQGRFGKRVLGYADLWDGVRNALDSTHAEGRLKAEIVEAPDAYVDLDPDLAPALLDLRDAGKRLLLVTNSEWPYTKAIMGFALDRFLPAGTSWQSLFDLVIVSARKPEFFSGRMPLFEVASDEGLLRPCVAGPTGPGAYLGGHAALVEQYLGLSGSEILYIGDHLYTDVRISKDMRRWRTGLIVRELEEELAAVARVREAQERLDALMAEKARLEFAQAHLRLRVQRAGRAAPGAPRERVGWLESQIGRQRVQLERLDDQIGPIALEVGSIFNDTWGPLMSAGADRSHLARQLEASADIYTSRVSNLLYQTPFAYLRAPRGRMPHDIALERGDD
jgi:HAD superfamily 5'-nucleotidase-like hydrolase